MSCGLMSPKIAANFKIIPIAKFGPVLTVAMAEPLNLIVRDELEALTALEIIPVAALPQEILEAIEIYSSPASISTSPLQELKLELVKRAGPAPEVEEGDIFKLTEISSQQTIINMFNNILIGAIRAKASDIHIEPYEEHLRLRYRVDGVLGQRDTFPKDIQDALFARIKIMSRLDITERRIPQDGRFSINFENRQIDFRISILPTYFGEKTVLRILDKEAMKLDLTSLGFSPSALKIYAQAISEPFGLILITGPTGSGKSTTLYSMLSKLNTHQKSIITIEDPIEYYLKGITQIQIKPEIGLSFAQSLRSVLRQSPDIIMVGEIRDIETADAVMKAALTGHLVLSTLHTNDALASITRLMDMGLEPFLIAGSLRVVSAQRLCRKLCPACKEKYSLEASALKKFSLEIQTDTFTLYRAKGCPECSNSGYRGRVGIVEVCLLDDPLREMIIKRVPLAEIKEYARGKGMQSLKDDGLAKALAGEVSLEEIIRASDKE